MEGVLCQDELFLLSEDIFTPEKVPEDLIMAFKVLVKNRDVGRKINSVLCKATSELEYAKMIKHSYSYYQWDGFPISLCQGRDALCMSVLNDKFISLPQGSEMFKFKVKNQYEEILYQLEDTMTHHDFQIGN
jgi:paired amphipathic helix protein Sin3a